MPLTMAYRAVAMVRASAGVASESCGSVSGLVMMVITFTRFPPSWAAMEPQKFSAATTCRGWAGGARVGVGGALEAVGGTLVAVRGRLVAVGGTVVGVAGAAVGAIGLAF